MKNNAIFRKVLLLTLCLVLILSCFAACGQKKIDALEKSVGELQTQVSNNASKLEETAKSVTLEELRALVDEIKTTADAAATAEKLENVVSELATVKGTADAAATATALANAVEEIEALIAANGEADTATGAALNETLTAALAKITALEESYASTASLNAVIAEIRAAYATNESVAQTAAKLETVIANLEGVKATADAAATATALTNAVEEIEALIAANGEADTAAKAALDEALNAALAKITALEDTYVNTESLNTVIEEIRASYATNESLSQTAAKLETVISNLAAVKDTADAAATATALTNAVEEIEALIAANGEAGATTKATLEGALAKITALEESCATVEALDAAVAAIEAAYATNEDLAAVKTDLDALEATVAANTAADSQTKAALEKEIADIKTALATKADATTVNGKFNALHSTVATLASKAELNQAVNTLSKSVSDLKTELEKKILTVSGKFDALSERVNGNAAAIEGLKNELDTVKETLDELLASDFADKYQAATELLQKGDVGDNYTHSLRHFEDLVKTVEKENYADADFAAFEATVADLRFFLNRALSVEQILGYFTELNDAINGMPTLAETLDVMLTVIENDKTITTDPACLDQLKAVYAKATGAGELDAVLESRYTLVVNAHNNIVAAKAATDTVVGAINGIATPIVYADSENAVASAEELFASLTIDYFGNDEYNNLYSDELTAEKMVTNYETLLGYRARLTQLTEAFAAKVSVIELALGFDIDRPLYSDLTALSANKTEVDAWIELYSIDEANLFKIYGAEYTLLAKAYAYAEAMDALYTSHEVASLNDALDALCGKALTVITDDVEADALKARLDALNAAIEAVIDYDAIDENYVTMIGSDRLTNYDAVTARIAELYTAKGEVEAIVELMEALRGNVVVTDYTTIKSYGNALASICSVRGITEGDENYILIVADAQALCDALLEEYRLLTEMIAEIYMTVEEKLNDVAWKLADGNKIIEIQSYLDKLPLEWNLPSVNMALTLVFEDGSTQDTNLEDLYMNWSIVVGYYNTLAANAQTSATDVTATIAGLSALNPKDIKDFAAIEAIRDVFGAWALTYLEIDVTTADAADVKAAVDAVQAIQILAKEEGTYYVFVSSADCVALSTAYSEAKATLSAAEETWNGLSADMDALIADWNIHSSFDTVISAYTAYLTDYYAGSVDADSDLFGECDKYAEFGAVYAVFSGKLGDAQNDAASIKGAINVLPTIDMTNAHNVIILIETIDTMVANYESNYGCAILSCDKCGITADEATKLAKARAQASYTAAYADFITDNALDDTTVVKRSEVEGMLTSWNAGLNRAETQENINAVESMALSLLQSFQNRLDAANP